MIRLLVNRPGGDASVSSSEFQQAASAYAAGARDCPRLGGMRPIAEALAVALARYERQLAPENSQPALTVVDLVLPQGMEAYGV